MLVVYNSAILRNGFLSVMTQDMRDTLVVPVAAYDLFCQFFIMQDFLVSECYEELAILEDDFDIVENRLFYRDQYIADKVWNVVTSDMLVLRGNIFMSLVLNDKDYCLAVVSLDKHDFIGIITPGYSVRSSAELSRLVLSTSEVDWQI